MKKMKKYIILLISSLLVLFSTINTNAQEKAKTKIAHVKLKNDKVRFTLTSSKPFIYASNRYILYIGDKEFSLYEQSSSNGKGTLTFLIPKTDFDILQDGKNVYLSYGEILKENTVQTLAELSKESYMKCWALGKFNKKLLSK